MTRRLVRSTVLAVTTTALASISVLGQPGSAVAGEFGQHVRGCARAEGFSGAHNPGKHYGASQFDIAVHACSPR